MNSGGKFHIESLFDWFQKHHHEVMSNIEAAESENVLVVRPFTFHQRDIEPFLLEKSFLDRAEDWRFARDADVANADLVRNRSRVRTPSVAAD